MKKLIKLILSTVMTTCLLFSSSVYADTSPEYVTRYDFVTNIFTYDVCNVETVWSAHSYSFGTHSNEKKELFINPVDDIKDNYSSFPMTKVVRGEPEELNILEEIKKFDANYIYIYKVGWRTELDSRYQKINRDLLNSGYIKYDTTSDIYTKKGEERDDHYGYIKALTPESRFSDVDLRNDDIESNFNKNYSNEFDANTSFMCADFTGILIGYPDKTFKPENYITKEDALTIIYRIFDNPYFMTCGEDKRDPDMPTTKEGVLHDYSDYEDISPYARDAVSVLTQIGFVEPDRNGKLNPKSYLTNIEMEELSVRLEEKLDAIMTYNYLYLKDRSNVYDDAVNGSWDYWDQF